MHDHSTKYQHWVLPMGFNIDTRFFQNKRSTLFQGNVHICLYMDELVTTSNNNSENYMDIIYDILNLLENPGMQFNTVQLTCDCNYTIYRIMVTYN